MVKELKINVDKVTKMMYKQHENINKETENLKRNKKYILELRSTTTRLKNLLVECKDIFEQVEEKQQTWRLATGITKPGEQKEKKIEEEWTESKRPVVHKQTNIHIMVVPEWEERENRWKEYLK